MKKLILGFMLFLLGCGNPLSGTSQIERKIVENSQAELIKIEVSQIGEDDSTLVNIEEPVSQETIDIIQSTLPPVTDLVQETVSTVVEPTQDILSPVIDQAKESVPSLINQAQEAVNTVVEQVEETVNPVTDQIQDVSNPVADQAQEVAHTVSDLVPESLESEKEETAIVVYESNEVVSVDETLPHQDVLSQVSETQDSKLPETSNSILPELQVQETAPQETKAEETPLAIDPELVAELEKITYSEESSDVTMVTYKKEKDSLESYTIYSQVPKDSSWVKEFTVSVDDGKVKSISSHNNKKIESFSEELEEIVSLEKKFKEKLNSSDVDELKEMTVSQFVKNKKHKKTSKLKNKKFGKKSKKKHRR